MVIMNAWSSPIIYILHLVFCSVHPVQDRLHPALSTATAGIIVILSSAAAAHYGLQSRPSCELRRAEIPSSASSHVTVCSKVAQWFVKASFCHLWWLQVHYAFSTCWWFFHFCVQVVTGHFLNVAGGQGVGAEKRAVSWTQEFTEKCSQAHPSVRWMSLEIPSSPGNPHDWDVEGSVSSRRL